MVKILTTEVGADFLWWPTLHVVGGDVVPLHSKEPYYEETISRSVTFPRARNSPPHPVVGKAGEERRYDQKKPPLSVRTEPGPKQSCWPLSSQMPVRKTRTFSSWKHSIDCWKTILLRVLSLFREDVGIYNLTRSTRLNNHRSSLK